MRVLVIIPCYNEEGNILNTVNDLNKITGVSAGFVNTQTGFTKTMKINYSETSENLTKYDRIYYEFMSRKTLKLFYDRWYFIGSS